jgi:aspartate racemase
MNAIRQYDRRALGIVGGLGPLASAEFLKTIYEYSLCGQEQTAPVVMYSDPGFPDRTEEILRRSDGLLLEHLVRALQQLAELGVSKTVICCITIHYLLPQVPLEYRRQVVSLLDVIFDAVSQSRKRHLLICSLGARKLKLFEKHPSWRRHQASVVLPDENDQRLIHYDLIYQIKKNANLVQMTSLLESLLQKYQTDSFISGCTEIHLLSKQTLFSDFGRHYGCVDPLMMIAQNLLRTGL